MSAGRRARRTFPYGAIAAIGGLALLLALHRSHGFHAAAARLPLRPPAGGLRFSYLAWVAAWSGAAFVLYLVDKVQALRRGPRVPENVLHRLALAGGFPGAWAGMLAFRHKVRHRPFWLWLSAATALHACLVWWWLLR